ALALVIAFQGAGDGELAAAALAFGDGLFRRRRLGRAGLARTLLAAFFFFLVHQAAARRFAGDGRGGGIQALGGFLFGALLGGFVGGLAGFFLDLALLGGQLFGLQL